MARSFFKCGYYPALVEGTAGGYFLEFFGWNQRSHLKRAEARGDITRLYDQAVLGPVANVNEMANRVVEDYRRHGIEVVTFEDKSPPAFKGITDVDQATSIVAAMRRESDKVVECILG